MCTQEGEASSSSGTLKTLESGTLKTLVAQETTGSLVSEARPQEVQPRWTTCGLQEVQPRRASHGPWSPPLMTQGTLVVQLMVTALIFQAGQLTRWTQVEQCRTGESILAPAELASPLSS